jgi:Tol biopolymer transport system component
MDSGHVHAPDSNVRGSGTGLTLVLASLLVVILTLFIAGPAVAAVGTILRASCTATGERAGGIVPAISGDGRYIAFASGATNLVVPPTSGWQLFRKDLSTGAVALVSSSGTGRQGNGNSGWPVLSYDGRYVAFYSDSTNIVAPATGNQQIFRKDMVTGEVRLASANSAGAPGNGNSFWRLGISADGRYVAFASDATNLAASATTSRQVFRKDLQTAAVMLCSTSAAGAQGDGSSYDPCLSADGRFVAFGSVATNLVAPVTSNNQVFRKDLETSAVTLVSANWTGAQGNSVSGHPSMSPDGVSVGFESASTNLVTPSTTGYQVFIKNMATSVVRLMSANPAGVKGNGDSLYCCVSTGGNYVAFQSVATNLVSPGTTGQQVFRKDVVSGKIELVSSSATGVQGDAPSFFTGAGNMSAQGRFVSFYSAANNFLPPETVISQQVFRKELSVPYYFAEGTCRPGFEPYLTVQNPGSAAASTKITYMKGDGTEQAQIISVPAFSRSTVTVKQILGEGNDAAHDFSCKVECTNGKTIIAERPMYFNYRPGVLNWNGGTDVVGALSPAPVFYFAEGSCRSGFDPYLTIQNPGGSGAEVAITYMKGDGTTAGQTLSVPAHTRNTVTVKQKLGEGDDDAHDFSCRVASTNGSNIVVERPMYFNYKPGLLNWNGGHDVVGALLPAQNFYFAEGTCRPGFDPYLTIQNPGVLAADIKVTYMRGDGTTAEQTLSVPAHARSTVTVKQTLGEGNDATHDFSCRVACTNGQTIIAERPMYFDYRPGVLDWNGGTDVVGATAPATSYYFAEGTCRPGFDPYLTIQNPGGSATDVTIVYMKGDGTTADQTLSVPAHARSTITVKQVLGEGDNTTHDFSCNVACSNGQSIIVERPMYFNYKPGVLNWTGGTDVVGLVF